MNLTWFNRYPPVNVFPTRKKNKKINNIIMFFFISDFVFVNSQPLFLQQVFIYGLYSTENHRDMIVGRLVRAIAIDPFYYKPGSGRRFITGKTMNCSTFKMFVVK